MIKEVRRYFDKYSYKKFRESIRFLFEFKYPKLILLALSIVFAYYLFRNPVVVEKIASLHGLSYFGIFIAGLLFSFGFTAPFAFGFFLVIKPENIFLTALIGGFGAFLSDMIIFKTIKFSLMDEFLLLKKTTPLKKINKIIKKNFEWKIRNYILYFFAGLIIASPLPDEIGIAMLAGLTEIDQRKLGVISIIMNTIGIFILLLI